MWAGSIHLRLLLSVFILTLAQVFISVSECVCVPTVCLDLLCVCGSVCVVCVVSQSQRGGGSLSRQSGGRVLSLSSSAQFADDWGNPKCQTSFQVHIFLSHHRLDGDFTNMGVFTSSKSKMRYLKPESNLFPSKFYNLNKIYKNSGLYWRSKHNNVSDHGQG